MLVLALKDIVEMETHVLISTNVLLLTTTVIQMQIVQTISEALIVNANKVIKATEEHVPTSMNAQLLPIIAMLMLLVPILVVHSLVHVTPATLAMEIPVLNQYILMMTNVPMVHITVMPMQLALIPLVLSLALATADSQETECRVPTLMNVQLGPITAMQS